MLSTLTLCGNISMEFLLCSHKGLGLGQEAFKTIVKNNNPVCNLHIKKICKYTIYLHGVLTIRNKRPNIFVDMDYFLNVFFVILDF